ncbi:homeobox protein Meis3-like isoform X1 [Lethenteron reissneri]|uniref:homeobox protein Meis3-like isoform X1 n=2 Tax=Lethenteron reissneri TaxID=7753 RepID=UPI002AB69080|nr:homeobox protein Meis3-like isoform X1 [Lethenteron reissneri]XP_061406880.1 homeobox protein Meis3-like isoform X1 [Lethenteron reissneri]
MQHASCLAVQEVMSQQGMAHSSNQERPEDATRMEESASDAPLMLGRSEDSTKPLDPKAQMDADKNSIYSHPLFPLLRLMMLRCEEATQGAEGITSAGLSAEIQAMLGTQSELFSGNGDTDSLMLKAVQVLRIHLLELEKVRELCQDFCERYIACLRGKLSSDNLLRGDAGPASSQLEQAFYALHSPGNDMRQDRAQPVNVLANLASSTECHLGPPHRQGVVGAAMHHGNAKMSPAQAAMAGGDGGFPTSLVLTLQSPATPAGGGASRRQHSTGGSRSCFQPLSLGPQCGMTGDRTRSPQERLESFNHLGHLPSPTAHQAECDLSESDDRKMKSKRGVLPKHATGIMRSWLFQHIVHPYPTEDEKRQIAAQTNLTLLQVNNWFINARRRILQPMLDAGNTSGGNPAGNSVGNATGNPEGGPAGCGRGRRGKAAPRALLRFWPEQLASTGATGEAEARRLLQRSGSNADGGDGHATGGDPSEPPFPRPGSSVGYGADDSQDGTDDDGGGGDDDDDDEGSSGTAHDLTLAGCPSPD